VECALGGDHVERAANDCAVGPQPTPLVERILTSLCGVWWPEPRRPESLCALADECRAPRSPVWAVADDSASFGWSCPRATRARSCQYVLRPTLTDRGPLIQSPVCLACVGGHQRGVRQADLADKGELGANLTGAWSPRIALSPMMTRRAVAHFGNGFDESLRSLFFAPKLREPPLPLPPCRKVSHSLHSNGC
jgi:hypothetical protein